MEDADVGEVEEVDGGEADVEGGDADAETAGTCGSAGTAIARCCTGGSASGNAGSPVGG